MTMSGPRIHICPPSPQGTIPPGTKHIHPGFGVVALCRDGVQVIQDIDGSHDTIDYYTRQVDKCTLAGEPPRVWTLHIDGPLSNQVYAFTADRQWTLIEKGRGFA